MKNVVITERDFEQFIFVNRAAQKWKTKLKKNKEVVESEKDVSGADAKENNSFIVEPEPVTDKDVVTKSDEADESDNMTDINDIEVPLVVPEDVPLLSHGELRVPPTTVYDDGRFVTDV